MKKHWYLVGQRAGARIFEQQGIAPELTLIHRFENPDGLLKTSELVSDHQGRSDSSDMHGGHNAVGEDEVQRKQVLEKFAHDIGTYLEKEAEQHMFQSLVLVAEPHFLGVVKKAIGKATSHLILESLVKDLVNISDHDMAAHLSGTLCYREAI